MPASGACIMAVEKKGQLTACSFFPLSLDEKDFATATGETYRHRPHETGCVSIQAPADLTNSLMFVATI